MKERLSLGVGRCWNLIDLSGFLDTLKYTQRR